MCSKKVAVIGAGASGLTAIKCCLDEGLEPICYERSDDLGGLWRYTETSVEGEACVMKSTVINTSKEMMAYSDFPIPEEFPAFMHNTKVCEYLRKYSQHFGCDQYINYRVEVVSVKKSPNYDDSGRWNLHIKNLATGKEETKTFDAVFVCTGHHADAHRPKFDGLDGFRGNVTHTHEYKNHRGYEDKRVVVIGIGNSGGDVAVELSKIAKEVYLSTRRGSWVLNRVAENGLPVDMVHSTRFNMVARQYVSLSKLNDVVEGRLNRRFDHENFGLKPKHRFTAQHPMVNDDLPNRIICGAVVVKPDVKKFTETSVEFVDGTKAEVDAVVLATGYIFGFPFLDSSIVRVEHNEVNLYKYVYPPELKHPTLAVIGCFQPLGAIMPLCEMQCRWATRLLKKLCVLPSSDAMWKDIRMKREAMSRQYVKSQRHTIQVDYAQFMCELAELIGCQPHLFKLWLTDPSLAWMILFGPLTPYQFRLHGPGAWAGARKAIEGQMERTVLPTRRKPLPKKSWAGVIKALFVICALFVVLFLFFG